tara:strand:+ start:2304 stop:2429 length:126 start_codon:yes stop_codon:yes gene_type:complete
MLQSYGLVEWLILIFFWSQHNFGAGSKIKIDAKILNLKNLK